MGDCQCFIVSLYLSLTHTYTHLKSYGMSNPKRCSRVENRFCSIIPLGRESKHPPKHTDRSATHTHTHIACIHTAHIVYTLECSEAWGQCYVQWWAFCSDGGKKKQTRFIVFATLVQNMLNQIQMMKTMVNNYSNANNNEDTHNEYAQNVETLCGRTNVFTTLSKQKN